MLKQLLNVVRVQQLNWDIDVKVWLFFILFVYLF